MPDSQVSHDDAVRAINALENAIDKKWFLPHHWLRPRISHSMSGSKDTGWHIVIHVEKERHRKYVLKLAKKVIPDVPIEVSVTGIIVAH